MNETSTRSDVREVAGNGMLREVREGLRKEQKELSPKYFYDRRGSELFEEITRLPEYYLTRAEIRILEGPVKEWLGAFRPLSLMELGSGSGRKTRLILDGMLQCDGRDRSGGNEGSNGKRETTGKKPSGGKGREEGGEATSPGEGILFVPVDVSADFLAESAGELRRSYPAIRIEPLVADMSAPDFLHREGSDSGVLTGLRRPVLFALLGSTIGNFRTPAAVELLSRISGIMTPEDRFLLGVDLRPGPQKPVERLETAYNDPAGVTARFNRNVLRVLNRELGTDFDLSRFRHRAFYDEEKDRIEMHLESDRDQMVRLPDGTRISFAAGESVRTEVSHKYDRTAVEALMEAAGLELTRWLPGAEGLYAMAAGRTPG